MPGTRRRRSDSEFRELVLEFEHHALGGLLADSGHASELGGIAAADGAGEVEGVHPAENVDGELGADAADREKFFKERLLFGEMKAEERNLIFADMGVDEQRHVSARPRAVG